MRENHVRILCSVIKVDLVYEAADGSLTAFFDNVDESPLMQSANLRRILREGAQGQPAPFLRHNAQDCYFAAIHTGNGFLYMGPMAHQRLNAPVRRQMYLSYGIESEGLPVLPVHTLPEIRNMILLTNTVLENASPQTIFDRGYSMVTGPDGKVVRDAAALNVGDKLVITPARGKITANVVQIE